MIVQSGEVAHCQGGIALGNEICDSETAALRFSKILGEFLLEFEVSLRYHGHHGRHRVRKIESTVSALAAIKCNYQNQLSTNPRSFLTVMRAHNQSLRYLRKRQEGASK